MTQQYLFPRTQREYQRQLLQARFWERATRLALESVGPISGGHVLDVGCGCGGAAPLLVERVGEHGSVTGVDIDTEALSVGTRMSASSTGAYRFVELDISQQPKLYVNSFDLIFARMVLLHMQRPIEVLQRLWQWVRPGGTLLVMDYDLTSSSSFPQHSVIERALRFSIDAFRRGGLDIEIGSRMPALFVEAGLPAPDGCEVASMILPAAPSVNILRETLISLRGSILRSRLADEAKLDRTDAELSAAAEAQVHVRWPDMVATWKRKPI
jgi:SAM-dependent methyltransferase